MNWGDWVEFNTASQRPDTLNVSHFVYDEKNRLVLIKEINQVDVDESPFESAALFSYNNRGSIALIQTIENERVYANLDTFSGLFNMKLPVQISGPTEVFQYD